jgi:hypothetical protein
LPGSALIIGVEKFPDMIWLREWDSYDGDFLEARDRRKLVTFST